MTNKTLAGKAGTPFLKKRLFHYENEGYLRLSLVNNVLNSAIENEFVSVIRNIQNYNSKTEI